MDVGNKKLLLCNCERTMPLDANRLAKACGSAGPAMIHSHLCRTELDAFRRAAAAGDGVMVACTQEAPLFSEIASEDGHDAAVSFFNIRERGGWSAEAREATPKLAALIAEAALEQPPAASVELASEGTCLVYGRDETAVAAARQLAGRLDVTVLLHQPDEIMPPDVMDVPIFRGTIKAARGHLGAFEIVVDDYAPAVVSSRSALSFDLPRDGASSNCDLILDLSGADPLFPSWQRRDGYMRPDPGNPAAVQRALFDLVEMVGTFEKPRYVDFHADLCAHSRSRKTGCTRCLDACPASAIQPGGDSVAIDPYLCGGCGACNSVCPTGAASYAYPPTTSLLERAGVVLSTYLEAGGDSPALLVHDGRHGSEMIALMARFGRGLPARVLPFAVNEVTQVGLDFLLGALAKGAQSVILLAAPERREERAGLAAQIGVAEAVLSGLGYEGGRVAVIDDADPEAVEAKLYALKKGSAAEPAGFLPMGDKRGLIRLALDHLHRHAPAPVERIGLPPGAPFGRVRVDTEGCTLCLACVGACPTGAVKDNPERPQLSFQEDACIQCGLCKATCPEQVITLESRLNFAAEARAYAVIKEEEPFHCVSCGKPFGTKSSIERIIAQLANKHWMFQDEAAVERMKMCEDCRVSAQFIQGNEPFAMGTPPRPRTTQDYLREREEAAGTKLGSSSGDETDRKDS
jgi:ferredoxin